jgi:hypothetical protein
LRVRRRSAPRFSRVAAPVHLFGGAAPMREFVGILGVGAREMCTLPRGAAVRARRELERVTRR